MVGIVAPFVAKLLEIINFGDRCAFTRGGTVILIQTPATFAEEVLPKVRFLLQLAFCGLVGYVFELRSIFYCPLECSFSSALYSSPPTHPPQFFKHNKFRSFERQLCQYVHATNHHTCVRPP